MKEENKIGVGVLEGQTLEVFCFDSVGLKDRTTFDDCIIDGVKVTFWTDEEEDIQERLKRMFDILFKEMIKNRGKKPVEA